MFNRDQVTEMESDLGVGAGGDLHSIIMPHLPLLDDSGHSMKEENASLIVFSGTRSFLLVDGRLRSNTNSDGNTNRLPCCKHEVHLRYAGPDSVI